MTKPEAMIASTDGKPRIIDKLTESLDDKPLKSRDHTRVIRLIPIICTHLLQQHLLEPTGDVLFPVVRQLSQQSYF